MINENLTRFRIFFYFFFPLSLNLGLPQPKLARLLIRARNRRLRSLPVMRLKYQIKDSFQ